MRFWLVATFVVGTACGGTESSKPPPTIESLFPADNELGGWTQVKSVEKAQTPDEAMGLINGHSEPYAEVGFDFFARCTYQDGNGYELLFWIWQMKNSDDASQIFDHLTHKPAYIASSWSGLEAGDAGRYANTGVKWWLNARKGTYYVEAWIGPNDDAGKTAGVDFLSGALSKM